MHFDSHVNYNTVKPFNLTALKVGDFVCKIIFVPLFWQIRTIQFEYSDPFSYFGMRLIFVPFSFAVLFGSWNKGHATNKGFTIIKLEWLAEVEQPATLIRHAVTSVLQKFFLLIFPTYVPSLLWHCWLCDRKSIRPVKNLSDEMLVWLSVWIRCKWLACGPADATATASSLLQ